MDYEEAKQLMIDALHRCAVAHEDGRFKDIEEGYVEQFADKRAELENLFIEAPAIN